MKSKPCKQFVCSELWFLEIIKYAFFLGIRKILKKFPIKNSCPSVLLLTSQRDAVICRKHDRKIPEFDFSCDEHNSHISLKL